MTVARSASLRRDQPAISARVRRQPRQTPVRPSTAQTFTQGVAIARGGVAVGEFMTANFGVPDGPRKGKPRADHRRGALCIGRGLA
jgi:hypothetical protein